MSSSVAQFGCTFFCIMLLSMGVHGAWITEELARHGYDISPGTLYPTLHRMEADGLLSSKQRIVDGRTRRVYRVTQAGRRALREDRKALEELAREVLGDKGV